MPGPDPSGIEYSETADGRWSVFAYVWPKSGPYAGNRKHRMARLRAVIANLKIDGWLCSWCSNPVPLWRRADAQFCCEACRKKAARERRAWAE